MGTLHADLVRGDEVFSFSYDPKWLKSADAMLLDPDLGFYEGSQYLPNTKRANFGVFLDSSPDRWGRVLMRRRQAMLTKGLKPAKKMVESDFLLGVHDAQRMGGLRFQTEEGGAFLSDDEAIATPPWTSLRELEAVSWRYQKEDFDGTNDLRWLGLLLAPGSSLGGARPKAGVRDLDGDLWIAKFPGRSDERDMGAWEFLTWHLARDAGLNVGEAKILDLGTGHRTFATKRFDRIPGTKGNGRIHFASAMTLLGRSDGDDGDSPPSYLDLAELISSQGESPSRDLPELWSRIVFSILVSNTDDHLRNHGFVLTPHGWRLSPAYDINPDPDGRGLSLNIDENDNRLDLDLALSVCPHFRLIQAAGERRLAEIKAAVAGWRDRAVALGISRSEVQLVEPAFAV